MTPYIKLAEQLGSFAGQLTETRLKHVRIEYTGEIAEMNTRALTAAMLAGLLRPQLTDVNMVSAPAMARERGLVVEEVKRGEEGAYQTYVRLIVETERGERSVAGTVFSDGRPRIIQIKGIGLEAELSPHMLYITNQDKPGFIGKFGTLMGEAGVNIATLNLGRDKPGGDAICLVALDEPISDEILAKVRALPMVTRAHRLAF